MNTLSIDFETRSTENLSLTGVYQYAAHPSTDVWCMAYAHGDNTPKIWYVGEPIPESVAEHIHDGGELRAWNAQFERIMWAYVFGPRYGFPTPDLDQWHCTAAEAGAMSLPRALQTCAAALGADAQKDMEGNRVILQMMRPRKIDKKTGAVTWWEDDYRMARGGDYCLQDVVVEREVAGYVNRLTERERDLYLLDQQMNDRGVGLDRKLCVAMQSFAAQAFNQANEAIRIASNGDIEKVTKVRDITDYLRNAGVDVPNLTAQTVAELQTGGGLAADVTRIIDLRAEAGKASVSKIKRMLEVVMDDDRMRGLMMYFGANTGRWAGRLVQPHNFPRPNIKDIEWFIEDVMGGELAMVDLYAPPLHVVASMLRSVLVPAPGNRFLAGDFSQIEARVVAWIARQDDLVELFRTGGKVYEEMASVIYHVPLETVTEEQRWTGKQTVLGCGFQMGVKRFVKQCRKYGVVVSPELAEASVTSYRTKYDRIPALWRAADNAAIEAAKSPGVVVPVGSGSFVTCDMAPTCGASCRPAALWLTPSPESAPSRRRGARRSRA